MQVSKDKRMADVGEVCVLKNKFTKEVEYLPLSEVHVTYENEQMSLKEFFDKQNEMINDLNDKIKNLKQIIADYQESTTKLMATVSKAATTALQVAQNQSIQIETINQEVFK